MKKLLLLLTLGIFAGCESITDLLDEPTASASTKNAYVITVGVENGYAGKCEGAKVDCTRMKTLLKPYAKTQVSFVDSQATIAAVCDALKKGVQTPLCIFYFSGHGGSIATSQAANDPTEADKNDEFICLYDGGLLDNSIWNIISQAKGRVVLIFDACHSQTMYRSPITFAKQRKKLGATHKLPGSVSILCWSGCPDSSYSYGNNSGGKFTNCIRSNFSKNRTYNTVWKKVEANSSLKKYQKVQRTIIGTDFGSKKVFQ